MLTLTRKAGETIIIGENIEIVVKDIRRNQVRIGIVAPRDVQIYRREVMEDMGMTPQDLKDAQGESEEEEVSFLNT
jgi:carbon storage regulator